MCLAAPPVVVAGYQDQLERVLRLSDLPRYDDLEHYTACDSAEPMSTPEPDFSDIHSATTVDAAFEAAGFYAVRLFSALYLFL